MDGVNAAAGVSAYWIVNIPEGQIEVYESPDATDARYQRRADYKSNETIRLAVGAGRSVDVGVDEVLPTT